MGRMIDADELRQRLLKAYAYADNILGNNYEAAKATAFWEVAKWLDDMGTVVDDEGRFRLKERSEWLEDSDHGQEYGSTWACRKCKRSMHEQHVWNPYERNWRYCPWCGRRMTEKER